MHELLKLYQNRVKAVQFLVNKTTNRERRIELNERLQEITRAIYEIKKRM